MKSEYIRTLLEAMNRPKVKQSKDMKALIFKNEIASGITGNLSFRPSKSTGMAFDFKVNKEHQVKHLDSKPFNIKPFWDLIKKQKAKKTEDNRMALFINNIRNGTIKLPITNSKNSRTAPDSLGFGSDSSENYAQPDYSNKIYPTIDTTPGPDTSDRPIVDRAVRNMNNLVKRY